MTQYTLSSSIVEEYDIFESYTDGFDSSLFNGGGGKFTGCGILLYGWGNLLIKGIGFDGGRCIIGCKFGLSGFRCPDLFPLSTLIFKFMLYFFFSLFDCGWWFIPRGIGRLVGKVLPSGDEFLEIWEFGWKLGEWEGCIEGFWKGVEGFWFWKLGWRNIAELGVDGWLIITKIKWLNQNYLNKI